MGKVWFVWPIPKEVRDDEASAIRLGREVLTAKGFQLTDAPAIVEWIVIDKILEESYKAVGSSLAQGDYIVRMAFQEQPGDYPGRPE